MKNNFDKEILTIKKLFKKPMKKFLDVWKKEPDLVDFIQIYDNEFANNFLLYINSFIYLDCIEKQRDFNNDIFKNPDYYNVLKSLALLVLASQNNYTKNIFKNSLQGYHNEFNINIDSRIDDETKNSINLSSNIVYTLAYYLTKLTDKLADLNLVYESIYSYFVFSLLKTNLPIIKKKILFWKKESIDVHAYSIQYEIELEYFKQIQLSLRQIFPIRFNDLIYVINSTWPKMKK